MAATITQSNFTFLKDLEKNNNRDWFTEHKKRYLAEHENVVGFADALIAAMGEVDNIETPTGKKSLFRIYRDTRFSNNKTPYKTHWSGGLKRATKLLRGGYYFHIQPGESFVGGGFWGPNPDDLKRIREDIAQDDSELRKIIGDKTFVETFGTLHGDQVKTAPKGYSKDHPAIDLLRYKSYTIMRSFSDKEVLAPDFLNQVVDTFGKMRPFFDYMSEVLTTDSNGNPLH